MGKQYNEVCQAVCSGLEKYQGVYFDDANYISFKDRILDLKQTVEEAKKEGRLLKIGIVGEVKAGKSSFLNALVFDGEDVLPKAVTPMTAALTRISYSEKPSATIVFYTPKDWEIVESRAMEYDKQFEDFYKDFEYKFRNNSKARRALPPKKEKEREFREKVPKQFSACKELVEMYEKNPVGLIEALGTKREIPFDDKDALEDYIGVNGKYTPIVKYVELQMNNEDLKDVEIIDTPGLNDPIISRGAKTQEFMKHCDVIFHLSYAGQFLTQEDIGFLCGTLPKEGIKDLVVVCSKFDSGLLDYNKSKDIRRAIQYSICSYDRQAQNTIGQCMKDGHKSEALSKLKESLPPSCVSSLLYSCAMKKKSEIPYNEEEKHMISQLQKHFDNFSDDHRQLLELSGLNQVKANKLKVICDKKLDIIRESNESKLRNEKSVLLGILEDISVEVSANLTNITKYDKEELENKYETLKSKLQNVRHTVRNIFEGCAVDARGCLKQLKAELGEEVSQHRNINIETRTHAETKTLSSGFFGLFKTVKVFDVTEHYASVADIISNLRDYIEECKKIMHEVCKSIIDKKKLENAIVDAVKQAYDLSAADFDKQVILVPVSNTIRDMQIPDIDIDLVEYQNRIEDSFSDDVAKNSEIHKLRATQERELNQITKDLRAKLDEYGESLSEVINVQATTFVDNIEKQLSTNLDKLKTQLDDKEKHISNYNILLNELLPEYKKMVAEMELDV